MNDEDIARFRQRLLDLREELLALARQVEQSTQVVELDQTRVGRLSRIDALQAQQMALETERRRVIQLRQVDVALAKIERGDYGLCARCEAEIDPRRLSVNPLATHCIHCADSTPPDS